MYDSVAAYRRNFNIRENRISSPLHPLFQTASPVTIPEQCICAWSLIVGRIPSAPRTQLQSNLRCSTFTSHTGTDGTIRARTQPRPCRKVRNQRGGGTVIEECVMGFIELEDSPVVPFIGILAFSFLHFPSLPNTLDQLLAHCNQEKCPCRRS